MNIKNTLKEWLGISSAESVCEDCGDIGANIVYFNHKCDAEDSSTGKEFTTKVGYNLCHKCEIIHKYNDAKNAEFEEREKNKIKMERDSNYIEAQKYFDKKGE